MFKGTCTLPGNLEDMREREKGVWGLRKGDTCVLPAEKAELYSESKETKGEVIALSWEGILALLREARPGTEHRNLERWRPSPGSALLGACRVKCGAWVGVGSQISTLAKRQEPPERNLVK